MNNMSMSGNKFQNKGGILMSGQKTACITGVTGQDGAYLAQHLLGLDYRVVGVKRRSSTDNLWRLRVLGILDHANLIIEDGDVTDLYSLIAIFQKYRPHEVYNLAAMSHVGTSFQQPQLTWEITAQGAINVANAYFMEKPEGRLYQASSSEVMGSHYDIINGEKVQNEETKMDGNSPYGVAKFAAHNYMRILREGQSRFVCSGLLYNHSSKLRGSEFFERKVTKYVGALINWIRGKIGQEPDFTFDEENIYHSDIKFPKLRLGDLSTYRDMGHSKDYVKVQHQILQQDEPEDFVICTGQTYQMKDIVKFAFDCVGLDWEDYTYIDKSLFRPREVEYLRGDCSKAKEKLNWSPTYDLQTMIKEMVDQDIEWAKEGKNYG